jgi:hypothetical protein
MINTRVVLMAHDYSRWLPKDLMDRRGLVVVGVGRAGARGPQMLQRFSDIGERLRACGVAVIFVYPQGSTPFALDADLLLGTRRKQAPSLLVDDDGRFFRRALAAKALCVNYLDQELRIVSAAGLGLHGEAWDSELRAFLARVVSRGLH